MPVPTQVSLKDPKDFTLIGTPAKRLDAPGKVNGSAVYGIDAEGAGHEGRHGRRLPRVRRETQERRRQCRAAVKDVYQVVRLDNAVAVIAAHMGAAKKGLAALEIEWDEGPNAKLTTADIVALMAEVSESEGVLVRNDGDVDGALAKAATKLDAIYEVPFLAHTTMEPINCTVDVRKDCCEIWGATQLITRAQAVAAQVAGLPPEKVIVHNYILGGGFGRRLEVDFIAQAVPSPNKSMDR